MTDADELDLPITDFETVLRTTRSVRLRLDYDRPVPASVVHDCLDLALQAPTGGHAEDWRFIVIGDPGLKAEIGSIYRRGFEEYVLAPMRADGPESEIVRGRLGGVGPDGEIDERSSRMLAGAQHLAEHIGEAPWLVLPCATRPSPEFGGPGTLAGVYGSIFPAVWSFQLALRSRGLGTIITTLHLHGADEVADLLGIPAGTTQMTLLPVAYTTGTRFREAKRRPVREVAYLDRWGTAFDGRGG